MLNSLLFYPFCKFFYFFNSKKKNLIKITHFKSLQLSNLADGQYAEDEVMKDPDMPMEEAELMSPRARLFILIHSTFGL